VWGKAGEGTGAGRRGRFKGTVQRDFTLVFIICINRPRPEYEPFLILKLFRDFHDLIAKTTFFTQFRRNPFGKIIFL
jgi:hypothetical protein